MDSRTHPQSSAALPKPAPGSAAQAALIETYAAARTAAIDTASSGTRLRHATPRRQARTPAAMAIDATNSQVRRGTAAVTNGLRKNSAGRMSGRLSARALARPTDRDMPNLLRTRSHTQKRLI